MNIWSLIRTHQITTTVKARGRCVLALALVVAACIVAGIAPWSGAHANEFTFRGTVVDGETGAPAEGAVVVVVWRTYAPTLFTLGSATAYKVVEQVTGRDGAFEVDIWGGHRADQRARSGCGDLQAGVSARAG